MKLYISTGNSRMEKRWNNVEMELDEFINRISHTIRTAETVEQYMNTVAKAAGVTVRLLDAVRFENGEGIEKKQENFAEEIAKLAQ